jgi:sarcosine oxidase, subunit gamma
VAELDLERRAATHGLELPGRVGYLEVRETGPMAKFSLRCTDDVARSLSGVVGASLNEPINRAATAGECSSLRLGPDEWLIVTQESMAEALAARLMEAAGNPVYSLVDVSHRTAGLGFTGLTVADVLASGCPLPLEGDRFPIDRCTRTVFAKAEIILWRRGKDRFHMEVQRSYVPYLLALIGTETAPV